MTDEPRPAPPPSYKRPARWPWLLLTIAWLAGVCIALPAGVWLARGSISASQGAPNPTAAAHGVLDALAPFADPKNLNRYLCDDQAANLRARIDNLRAELTFAGNLPRLDIEDISEAVDGNTATVTASIALSYPIGGGEAFRGDPQPWTFHTHHTDGLLLKGWQVCQLDTPPLP